MSNLNPLYENALYRNDEFDSVDEKIAKIIFRKYPTIYALREGCENAYLRTGNEKFKKIIDDIENTTVVVDRFQEYSPRDIYYMALLQFVNRHKAWRRLFVMLAGTAGGLILGGVAGAAIDDAIGDKSVIAGTIGLTGRMAAGAIGSGIHAHKNMLRKFQNSVYDAYQKDHDVDNMLSKL